jgi:dienelactone hydrolase
MSLPGFERFDFTHDGTTRDVYRAGSGPAVIVVHEVPGLHPGVIAFGQRLVDAGYTVYLPSLFGRPGEPRTTWPMLRVMARLCVAREFAAFADRTSPVVHWLRALAARAHGECGGPGVGAVGMCFTGGYAPAMAVEAAVLAPVLSQPSLPLPVSRSRRPQLGLDAADLARIRDRAVAGEIHVLGLRFTGDRFVPPERFACLRHELGDAFEGIEIDSSPGNPYGFKPQAHAVLTDELVDEPGHPTKDALDRVMALFAGRLQPAQREE